MLSALTIAPTVRIPDAIAAKMGYIMSSLQISQGTFRLSDTRTLKIPDLTLRAGESWAFVGSNGSGKSALARAGRRADPAQRRTQSDFTRLTRLSFEQLQKLVSDEWQRNNTDCSARRRRHRPHDGGNYPG
jgi:molybdate transport system ATP-binding protein